MIGIRAEFARLGARMDSDLLPLLIEDSYEPTIPADPDISYNELGRRGLIRLRNFNVSVTIDAASTFVKERKAIDG